jgi:hypothetical protein
MRIVLRHGVITDRPEEVILRYYKEMGSGARAYDQGDLPPDNQFPREQLLEARRLANRLGGRGIPARAIDDLCARQSMIARKLEELPSSITILDESDDIPWLSITELFDLFRVPYVTVARYTKMLHKKRPNLIPILDSRVRDDYLMPAIGRGTISGLSEAEEATYLVREMKRDVSQNSEALLWLCEWRGKPYATSILRILDILIWCRFGPPRFRPRFASLYIG